MATKRKRVSAVGPTQREIELPPEPGESPAIDPTPTEHASSRAQQLIAHLQLPRTVPASRSRRADDSRRPRPYCWVSWITGLLGEQDKCLWRAWYRTHFRYAKRKTNDFDVAQWTRDHEAMLAARVDALLRDGWAVSIEDDNAFRFEGKLATLAGKPDLLALRGDECLVVDEKSGSPKPGDAWQVRIYMFVLPLVQRSLRGGYQIRGEVEYRGHIEALSAPSSSEREQITTLMRTVGGKAEPERTPSARECSVCDVLACPDRIDVTVSTATTDLF